MRRFLPLFTRCGATTAAAVCRAIAPPCGTSRPVDIPAPHGVVPWVPPRPVSVSRWSRRCARGRWPNSPTGPLRGSHACLRGTSRPTDLCSWPDGRGTRDCLPSEAWQKRSSSQRRAHPSGAPSKEAFETCARTTWQRPSCGPRSTRSRNWTRRPSTTSCWAAGSRAANRGSTWRAWWLSGSDTTICPVPRSPGTARRHCRPPEWRCTRSGPARATCSSPPGSRR